MKKQQNKKPRRCRNCRWFWDGGIKNGRYDRWCSMFSNVASKVQAQCIQSNAKETR